MKSTIHIDYDPELKEPVLTVDFVDSDDLKDKMLGIFLSKHIHSDKLLALRFKGEDRVLGVKRKRYQASVHSEFNDPQKVEVVAGTHYKLTGDEYVTLTGIGTLASSTTEL